MRTSTRGRLLGVAALAIPVLIGAVVEAGPGYAAGGTQLLVNGDFESGSLTGWTSVSAKLSVATDGDGGGRAARAAVNGKSKPAAFGLTTASDPVTNVPAGERYTATARVRSDVPGRTVCLVLRELLPAGATTQTQQQCATTTTGWASLPAASLTVAAPGHDVSVTVQQLNGAAGDVFEADNLSLVDNDTAAPTAPGAFTATASSTTEVALSWQPSSDTGGGGVSTYVVSRGGSPIATLGPTATTYADSGLTGGTAYSYSITATDYAGNVSAAASASVTTPDPPADSPPTVPGAFTATAVSSGEVDLRWTGSTDTDATGLAGYQITRNGSVLTTVGPTSVGYVDFAVSPSTTYTYSVKAYDTADNFSASTANASATTPAASAPGVIDSLWHMDETSGTTMVDSGSTPHHGILKNVTLGQPGDPAFPGTAYFFNGSADPNKWASTVGSSIDLGTANDLNAGSKDVRIAFSLKTTTVPPAPDYDLFRKGEYPGTEYKIEMQPNGQLTCEFRTLQADGSTVKGYTIQPAIDLHDGVWHRITCSKVGTTMTVTIDGQRFTKSITGSIANPYHMVVGAYSPSGSGDAYRGLLDELSFKIG